MFFSSMGWTRTARRCLATAATSDRSRIPQTVIEKVVQKYAVGLPPEKTIRAGDYVMIRPEHVMTHDNTGPVISKCVDKILSNVLSVVDVPSGSNP